MKLVAYFHDPKLLSECESRLRGAGIPTLVRSLAPRWGTEKAALFVYIDSQYPDAVELLRNPKHNVAHGVNVAEFDRRANEPFSARTLLWLALASLLLLALFCAAVYAVWRTG